MNQATFPNRKAEYITRKFFDQISLTINSSKISNNDY